MSPFYSQALGIASILLQTVIFMGLLLLLLRRWLVPIGSATLLFTLISVLADQYMLIPAAFIAGIIVAVLIWRLKPSAKRVVEFRLFAFATPIVYYSLYFLTFALTRGIDWSIDLWMGCT